MSALPIGRRRRSTGNAPKQTELAATNVGIIKLEEIDYQMPKNETIGWQKTLNGPQAGERASGEYLMRTLRGIVLINVTAMAAAIRASIAPIAISVRKPI